MTTDTFTVSASSYVRPVMWGVLAQWWWVAAIPALVLGVMALLIDPVWFFALLMVVCLLYPGLVMFVYIHYALGPQAVSVTLPHSVSIDADGLSLDFPDNPRFNVFYPKNDINGVEIGSSKISVHLKKPRHHHVTIPVDAIDGAEKEDFFKAVENLAPMDAEF